MKTKLLTAIVALLLTHTAFADNRHQRRITPDPLTPWATPQYFTHFQNERFNFSRLEEVDAGVALSHGEEGQGVKRVQQALLDMGFALPAGADGDFGGQTEEALRSFQSSRSLPQTGVLDRTTLQALDRVAPLPGKKIWEDAHSSSLGAAKAPLVGGDCVRALIDLSEHRLTVYSPEGKVQRVFPIATGADDSPTHVGLKIVHDKLMDPSPLAEKLWPESKGSAFGTRLLDLSWYDPVREVAVNSDEELHGTYLRNSLGLNASHGCVRLSNPDVEWIFNYLRVGDKLMIRD